MKYFFAFFLIYISAYKSFSAFDSYSTLYKSKITLSNGNQITGYYFHFNYDTIPKYSFTNKEFHEFLKIISKDTKDTIEIYSKLQNLNIPNVAIGDIKFSAVIKKDLYRLNIKNIKSVEFISSCKCDTSDKNCTVIKEFKQEEISKIQSGEVKFIHSVSDPNFELTPESGNLHVVFGKPGIINKEEFEQKIKLLYAKNEYYFVFDIPKYIRLKEELRKKGIILLTLGVTDYSVSSYLILN